MAKINSEIEFVDITTLDADCQMLIQQADANGAPNSNLIRILGHRPDILKGFFALWNACVDGGTLDKQLKELVRIKIAAMYGCGY